MTITRRKLVSLATLLATFESARAQSLDLANMPKMTTPSRLQELAQPRNSNAVDPGNAIRNSRRQIPVMFIGHGSPLNAISNTEYTEALRNVGVQVSRPKAILVVSAHWLTESRTAIMGNSDPRTIHDFSGFPPELAQIQYPAKGAPEMAQVTAELLGDTASIRNDWGFDHGTWSVLKFLFPHAEIPVYQLSIDIYKGPEYHYLVGKVLAALRDRDVMILGSGNIVHPERSDHSAPFLAKTASQGWATQFDDVIWAAIQKRDIDTLINYNLIPEAKFAVPFPDHYYPLLYVMGAAAYTSSRPRLIYQGWQRGTISMRCFSFH